MNNKKRPLNRFPAVLAALGIGLLTAIPMARGVPVAIDDFAGSAHQGWALASGNGSVDGAADDVFAWTGGNALQENVVASFESSTDNTVGFNGGDWAGSVAQSLLFTFDTLAGAPVGLYMYFADTSTGHGTWQYQVDLVSGVSQQYGADLSYLYGNGWYRVGGGDDTEAEFELALAGVDLVGLEIVYRPFEAGQAYALDDWQLNDTPLGGPLTAAVPEPGTCVILATAILSLAVGFRNKLTA